LHVRCIIGLSTCLGWQWGRVMDTKQLLYKRCR